jgi:hypothetical protein
MSTDADGWAAVRRTVLERDDYACRFCGITDDEHRDEHGRGLTAHHVIPDRDGGRDRPDNLITVCGSCHRTLESTHAKAIAQMKRREDYAEDLAGVTRVWQGRHETLDNIDDKLAEFYENNPVFAREMGLYDSGSKTIESTRLEKATANGSGAQVDTEWQFATAYGYREGVIDVVAALDGWTDVPFDEDSDT